MVKGQSGKSRKTKVVSIRLDNAKHKELCKLAGGKTKLGTYIQFLLIREATQ